ncbi:hypothetical protein FSHL1_000302 [Fusarium sambucinum]
MEHYQRFTVIYDISHRRIEDRDILPQDPKSASLELVQAEYLGSIYPNSTSELRHAHDGQFPANRSMTPNSPVVNEHRRRGLHNTWALLTTLDGRVLTGVANPELAHIFPHSALRGSKKAEKQGDKKAKITGDNCAIMRAC